MTLSDYRLRFSETLSGHFEAQELSSIFFLTIHHFLNIERYQWNDNKDILLTSEQQQILLSIIDRLGKAEPIQYILGETAFYGLTFYVDTNVLIPRPETEELVDLIIQDSKHKNQDSENLKILDVGTGSGCIAISLAKNIPNAKVYAIDVSIDALEVARLNATSNDTKITFFEADILNSANWNSIFKNLEFDIIVSNPPYVRNLEKELMQANVLEYEPEIALFVDDNNPLIYYKAIMDFAKEYLLKNGKVYFEINEYLGSELSKLAKSYNYADIEIVSDSFQKNRMLRLQNVNE